MALYMNTNYYYLYLPDPHLCLFLHRLSAFVAKSFHEAESYIYIDANLVAKTLEWIVARQGEDGSFSEPEGGRVIHTEMQVSETCNQGNQYQGHSMSTELIVTKVPRWPSPKLPKKLTKIGRMKACNILGYNSKCFWRYSRSNFLFYMAFLPSWLKCYPFEVSYLHFIHRQRSETCYTDNSFIFCCQNLTIIEPAIYLSIYLSITCVRYATPKRLMSRSRNGEFKMREIKHRMQSCRRRGISREPHTRSVSIGRRGVIIMWGVTARKASDNASNARAVTAGKMGRNSSVYNCHLVFCMPSLYHLAVSGERWITKTLLNPQRIWQHMTGGHWWGGPYKKGTTVNGFILVFWYTQV